MEEGLDTDDDDTDNAAPKSKHEQKLKPDPNLNKLVLNPLTVDFGCLLTC